MSRRSKSKTNDYYLLPSPSMSCLIPWKKRQSKSLDVIYEEIRKTKTESQGKKLLHPERRSLITGRRSQSQDVDYNLVSSFMKDPRVKSHTNYPPSSSSNSSSTLSASSFSSLQAISIKHHHQSLTPIMDKRDDNEDHLPSQDDNTGYRPEREGHEEMDRKIREHQKEPSQHIYEDIDVKGPLEMTLSGVLDPFALQTKSGIIHRPLPVKHPNLQGMSNSPSQASTISSSSSNRHNQPRPKPIVMSSSFPPTSGSGDDDSFIGVTLSSSPNPPHPLPPPRPSKSSLIQKQLINSQKLLPVAPSSSHQMTHQLPSSGSSSNNSSTCPYANNFSSPSSSLLGIMIGSEDNNNDDSWYSPSSSHSTTTTTTQTTDLLNPLHPLTQMMSSSLSTPNHVVNHNHHQSQVVASHPLLHYPPSSYHLHLSRHLHHLSHLPGTNNGISSSNNNRIIKRSSTFNSTDSTHDDLMGIPSTPSPSDSGIATEFESLLREKDAEISFLRETLEQNEQVIFKVYEEKEQSWQKEFFKLRGQFESSLTVYQKKVSELERKLSCRNQLEENIKELTKQVDELLSQRKLSEQLLTELKEQNRSLHTRLADMSSDLDMTKCAIEEEREKWSEEKDKVLLYQKQLNQHNLQILKRNKELESELRSLKESTLTTTIKTDDTTY